MKQYRPTKFNWWDYASGAMPRVFRGGGKSQTSTSAVSIPPEVLAQYQNVNSIANQVAQTPFQQYSQDPNAFVAPLTTTQQAGIAGTNQYASEAQPFYQQASNMIGGGYAPTLEALDQQYAQQQSQQLGNAAQNGAFGGDRAAVTAANIARQEQLGLGQEMGALSSTEANIGAGAQSAGLAGAQAQLTAGQAQQQTEQAGLTALYNQFLQQQSYPFQTTQFLANIAEGTGALSGSTTTSTQPSPYFSDERLKDDIEPIGKTFDGLNIIKFRYKGSKQPHIGLSAQDVERKHPDAVGLAGGYKTVDYDAATRDAAARGHRASQGGLVVPPPFHRRDGSVLPERAHFDVGGYAGLSPNSAWSGGFYLDPSYLQAQEAAYASAPWGNAGPVSGSAPYGGKSHVPPSMGGIHASLSVARPPAEHNSNGLQQLSSGLGQLEKLGGQGKSLFNSVKGYVPGLAPSSAPSATASTGAATDPGNAPPAPHQPPVTNDNAAPPASNDASGGMQTGLDPGDVGAPDLADLGLGDALTAKRGGRIGLDAGGTPSFSQPTDSGQDDQSDSGDVPYDSGTGASGLDIPDDKSNNKLAVAQPPSNSGSGGFNPLGLVGDVLGLFHFGSGGRVGLAGGGSPDDMPLPDLPTAANPEGLNLPSGIDTSWMSKPYGGHSMDYGPPKDSADAPEPSVGLAPPPKAESSPSRDITVHKAAPQPKAATGLNPDAPTPDAQPVQMNAPTVPPGDFGPIPEGMRRPTTNTTVQPMAETPGAADAARVGRGFFGGNQDWLVPLMHGLGTMASSNSRYLGSAILQGLGGAADSYENVQNEMMNRGLTGAGIQQGLAHTGETQANTGLAQGITGKIQSETTGHILQNEQTRQALQNGDVFTDGSGNTIVRMPNGQNIYWGDWAAKGFPPTLHQVHTTAGNPAAAPVTASPTGTPAMAKPAANFSYLGPNGVASASNDFRTLSRIPPNSPGYANMMDISHKTEEGLQARYQAAISNGATLNQISDELLHAKNNGILAPGAINQAMQDVVGKINGMAVASGHPEWQINPGELGTDQAINKLTAQMQFQRSQGADQHSMAALEIAGLATPGNYTTRNGQEKILAGLYALNQQDIDPYNYLQEYKRQVQATSPRPDWYLAQNAMQNFNKDHNGIEYQHIRQGMQDILSGKYDAGQKTPIYDRMLNGTLPPQAQQMLDKKYGVKNFGRIMRNE